MPLARFPLEHHHGGGEGESGRALRLPGLCSHNRNQLRERDADDNRRCAFQQVSPRFIECCVTRVRARISSVGNRQELQLHGE
jgi:hypothetical protein